MYINAYIESRILPSKNLDGTAETICRAAMERHPTPVPLPGKFHGWRSLAGNSSWGCKESDMTSLVMERQTQRTGEEGRRG